ncbi:synaptotagmin-11 [Ctenocephalides felis]|uniref:synaptotagmin-11 n=1 Tax=Ctenocephalides felis TaxID=7515 RepID=UPI000E6E34DB|nr:synaptotagmin-11 [Ctenocephalides felis]
MGEEGPQIKSLESVAPAILVGLACAAVLAAVAGLCVRRYRRRADAVAARKASAEAPLHFQPPRKPTAVRSPTGAPTHYYLKKSPSPTSGSGPLPSLAARSPPGLSPSMSSSIVSSGSCIPSGGMMSNGNLSPGDSTPRYADEAPVQTPREADPAPGDADEPGSTCIEQSIENAEHGKLGTLVFKLRYLAERSALVVSVVRCRGLPARNNPLPGPPVVSLAVQTNNNGKNNGSGPNTDPYVKLQLLPDKQHKVKTRVVRNTRNPVYDEDFTFYGLSISELSAMSLHFVVLSFDRYSRDDVIGEVVCALAGVDLAQAGCQQVALSREIQPRSLKIRCQSRGELLVSLCWQPAASRLTVVLLKARNLPRMDVTGLADPYVKIYLLYNGQRIAKKKTHVKKRTLNPVFNESFGFDIPSAAGGPAGDAAETRALDGVSLELLLLDWDRVTKNEVIGRLELGGPRSTGSTLHHWNEVCNSPRRQIADWHKLRE